MRLVILNGQVESTANKTLVKNKLSYGLKTKPIKPYACGGLWRVYYQTIRPVSK
jgi:hypothetical protein